MAFGAQTVNKPKSRNWYYKILRVAMKELSLAEDQYRELLAEFGATDRDGKPSASTMTVPQMEKALHYMKSCGFKPRRVKKTSNFKDGQIAKCRVIWGLLHNAGVMRQPYSDAALSKWAYRTTNVNQIHWASTTGLAKTIEALKSVAKRERVAID